MGDVTKIVIKPLLTLYGAPKSENVDAVFDLYDGILSFYSDDVLKTAMQVVLGDFLPGRLFPWPAPALIKRACVAELAKNIQPGSTWPAGIDAPRTPATPEQIARVNSMVADFTRAVAEKTVGKFKIGQRFPRRAPSNLSARITGERDE